MGKEYKAYTDCDGTMREIVIVGYDHKKFFHIKTPLDDGTTCIDVKQCYTHPGLKIKVHEPYMKFVFSSPKPYKEKAAILDDSVVEDGEENRTIPL